MNDLPVTLDQLIARLESLEQRVYVLEHPSEAPKTAVMMEASVPTTPQSAEGLSSAQTAGLFSVLGKAMLGIAGAYLLRAVAESTSLPKAAVAAIAIAYALMWLVWAVRVQADTWIPSAIYAGTSALILTPMIWELTLSFKVLSPVAAAAILAAFVLAASALAWKRDLTPVFWIANLGAAVAALSLAIATRELNPFLAVLLLMSLVCEYSSEHQHARSVRPFVAAAADLAVWVSIFIYSGPQSARADYPSLGAAALLAPACMLFLIYAASISIRTTILGQNITLFETLQATISFALAAFSVLSFAPQFGSIGLGIVCLLLSAACYALVFTFARGLAPGRNYQVFAAWGTALLLAGSLLCLPALGLALCLALGAVAFTLLGVRLGRLTLQVHGVVLLASVAVASGLLNYVFNALAGNLPIVLAPGAAVAAACALVCYAAGNQAPAHHWVRQSLRLIPAALAVCALTALLVQLFLHLVALRIVPDIYHVAFIRTLSICAVALALAFAGVRFHRPELTRIAYAAVVFVAAKLIFEDLRHGHLEFIAASIFLFAITLIVVPRLAHMGQKS
ncbi:MAG: hypothetical protein ACLPY1_09460 [Terracidiphilus sp.]